MFNARSPSAAALADGFEDTDTGKERLCVYNLLRKAKLCGGCGHRAKHHALRPPPDSEKEVDELRRKLQADGVGKGKGYGGRKGGNGKGGGGRGGQG